MRPGRRTRLAVIGVGALFALSGFWALHNLRLTLNGSSSLPDNAFIMWAWPQWIWRGAVIAAEPPAAYRAQFEGFYFTKRVVGLPGDRVTHEGDSVCVGGSCFELAERNGQPFAEPLEEGVIAAGMYAAFGTSPDSLDSRYGTVGLFRAEQIVAVGLGTNLVPHWKELRKWAEAHGY